MKRFLLIECDTRFSSVFVREVTQNFKDGMVNYTHEVGSKFDIQEFPGPKFYGMLDVLLVTAGRIANAEPIEPEAPAGANKIDSRIQESEQAVDRAGL